jgi:hypothetical protein
MYNNQGSHQSEDLHACSTQSGAKHHRPAIWRSPKLFQAMEHLPCSLDPDNITATQQQALTGSAPVDELSKLGAQVEVVSESLHEATGVLRCAGLAVVTCTHKQATTGWNTLVSAGLLQTESSCMAQKQSRKLPEGKSAHAG